jgi:hypothetical protein
MAENTLEPFSFEPAKASAAALNNKFPQLKKETPCLGTGRFPLAGMGGIVSRLVPATGVNFPDSSSFRILLLDRTKIDHYFTP